MVNRLTLQHWIILGLGSFLALFILLPQVLPDYIVILITESLIYAVAAMSLNLLLGYLGLSALGHAAYLAIGAYTTGVLVTRYQAGLGTNLFLSILFAAIAAAALTPLALRALSVYFLMITLSIALCVWGLAMRWYVLTGGDNGLSGISRPDLGLPWGMENVLPFYYLILIFFLLSLIFYVLIIRSPFGIILVAIRDSESRMSVLGYNVWLHKYLAFIIASAFAGGAGCLYTYYQGFTHPDVVNLEACMRLVLMVALGGPGTILGPILGAFVIVFADQIISVYTARWLMVVAALYFVTAHLPEGILGLLRRGFQEMGKRTREVEHG
jgi:branched-chain amino acid transport system permease protein